MTDLVFPKTQPVDKQVYVTIHNIQSMEMEKERIPSLFDKIKFNFIQDTFIEMFKTVLCCFYVSWPFDLFSCLQVIGLLDVFSPATSLEEFNDV